jgi:hypothetical protein
MPVERRGNLTIDCWDFAQGKACRGAIRRWTFGHHRCRKRHLPSGHEHGAWSSFAANSNAGGPAVRSSKKLAFTLPIFGETGMDFVQGDRGRKSKPTFLGIATAPCTRLPRRPVPCYRGAEGGDVRTVSRPVLILAVLASGTGPGQAIGKRFVRPVSSYISVVTGWVRARCSTSSFRSSFEGARLPDVRRRRA